MPVWLPLALFELFVALPFELFDVALFEVWCFDVLGFELPLLDGLQATKSPVEIKPINAIFAIVFISFSPSYNGDGFVHLAYLYN